MAWYYNNIRIYPQSLEKSAKQIIARLQPLSTGTVLQTFGYESPTYQMQCKVVGDSNREALEACATTGSAYTLTFPDASTESLYLSSVSSSQDMILNQTIDTSQDCETPVYTMTLEFYK